ncbi:MAG: hypothetical protein ACQSGP_11240 [Frankia sp.]
MLIDCDRCSVRGDACADCVVSALFAEGDPTLEWDETERRALEALADAGLIPRLRLAAGRNPLDPGGTAPTAPGDPSRGPYRAPGVAPTRPTGLPWPAAAAETQRRVG